MDVSKLFSRSPEQGEPVPTEQVSPIAKQKVLPEVIKNLSDEDVERFEDEGGSVIEEIETEIRVPAQNYFSITTSATVDTHPLYQRYNKFWFKVKELRDKKGKDYGTNEDPFANIRGAQEFGVAPWIGAANSANECLTRIKQYAKTGHLENDTVEDSMLDLANYALICLTLWDEAREENESNN